MRKVVVSEDGSSTIYQSEIDEHYHSTKGAVQESIHIFIEAALNKWLENNRKTNSTSLMNILEIGLGTGLNALLVALQKVDLKINYYSFEAFPLEDNIVKELILSNKDKTIADILSQIHACPWNQLNILDNNFSIYKINKDFTTFQNKNFENLFDVVFFDAFSPDKQPNMWSVDIFEKLSLWMKNNSVLTTYCAKGYVRRNMQEVGFLVERIPGPPGKREMLRATKI